MLQNRPGNVIDLQIVFWVLRKTWWNETQKLLKFETEVFILIPQRKESAIKNFRPVPVFAELCHENIFFVITNHDFCFYNSWLTTGTKPEFFLLVPLWRLTPTFDFQVTLKVKTTSSWGDAISREWITKFQVER